MTEQRTVWVDREARPLVAGDLRASLAWWLRDTGSRSVKIGCEEGVCGSCTVLVDGQAVPSCVVPLARVADGARIETAHGLATEPAGRKVLDALTAADALQCGFCGPGITVECVAALREHGALPDTAGSMRELLAGHLCRCTGYHPIVAALRGTSLNEPTQAPLR
jgi:aerobic-type carbon monoxide dehydrogenase small subunit (CoxS/CutS family)